MKIKILLVDDHTLIRSGMETLLNAIPDFEIAGHASNGKTALEACEKLKPDLVLLDINMPDMNGIEACENLKKLYPGIGVLFLSMHEEPEYVMKSMKSGGDGYLLKNVEIDELEIAIRKVAEGKKYFNAEISSKLVEGIQKLDRNKPEESLSEREIEILQLVAEGKSSKQIAASLFLSIRTVETHRVHILRKMKVANGAEMIKKAVEMGLIA